MLNNLFIKVGPYLVNPSFGDAIALGVVAGFIRLLGVIN